MGNFLSTQDATFAVFSLSCQEMHNTCTNEKPLFLLVYFKPATLQNMVTWLRNTVQYNVTDHVTMFTVFHWSVFTTVTDIYPNFHSIVLYMQLRKCSMSTVLVGLYSWFFVVKSFLCYSSALNTQSWTEFQVLLVYFKPATVQKW